jgi:hypothetical protein
MAVWNIVIVTLVNKTIQFNAPIVTLAVWNIERIKAVKAIVLRDAAYCRFLREANKFMQRLLAVWHHKFIF